MLMRFDPFRELDRLSQNLWNGDAPPPQRHADGRLPPGRRASTSTSTCPASTRLHRAHGGEERADRHRRADPSLGRRTSRCWSPSGRRARSAASCSWARPSTPTASRPATSTACSPSPSRWPRRPSPARWRIASSGNGSPAIPRSRGHRRHVYVELAASTWPLTAWPAGSRLGAVRLTAAMPEPTALRIALLAYRGNPHSGGQGVYIHYLSRELVGPRPPRGGVQRAALPRPGARRARWCEVPSLDLYRPEDPFRTPPAAASSVDLIDVLEFAIMCTAGFPEPLTFSLRARRVLRRAPGRLRRRPRQPVPGLRHPRHRPRRLARGGDAPPPDHRRPRPRAGPGRRLAAPA